MNLMRLRLVIRLRVMRPYISWVFEPFELVLQSAGVAWLDLSRSDDGFKGGAVVVLFNVSRMWVLLRQLALTDSMKTVGLASLLRWLCRLLEDDVILLSFWPRKASGVVRDLEGCLKEDLAVFGGVFGFFFDCPDPLACHFAGLGLRSVEEKVYLGLVHCSRRKKRFQLITFHSLLLNFQRHSYAFLHSDFWTVKTSCF